MAANTVTRVKARRKPISNITVPLKSGVALKQGNVAGSVPGTHTFAEIGNVASMIPLGFVVESKSQPAGDPAVEIELFERDNSNTSTTGPTLMKSFWQPIS